MQLVFLFVSFSLSLHISCNLFKCTFLNHLHILQIPLFQVTLHRGLDMVQTYYFQVESTQKRIGCGLIKVWHYHVDAVGWHTKTVILSNLSLDSCCFQRLRPSQRRRMEQRSPGLLWRHRTRGPRSEVVPLSKLRLPVLQYQHSDGKCWLLVQFADSSMSDCW